MNEIIKYHNDMNKISFTGFTEKELNLFFSLIFLAKEKGTAELTIHFSDLKSLSNDLDRNKKRFIATLNNINKKLIALHHQIKIDDITYTFSLFNVFGVNEKDNILTVEVNSIFSYMLNDLIGNFTKFELENFVNLKSSYSKNMFKLLKQWDIKKQKEFPLQDLKNLLGVPVTYTTSNFNDRVLKPIKTELSKVLPNLKIEKIKTGKTVTSLKFTWGKVKENIEYKEDIILEISEELEKTFEKASHNRFIQPFLTEENKAELIEFFEDEKILIKGLLYAYKTIQKEFKKLSYLIKVISTGTIHQNKTIKVVKKSPTDITVEDIQNDNIKQTSFDEISSPKEEVKRGEKIDIFEDEFEQIYQKFLLKNNIKNNHFTKQAFSIKYNIIKREEKKIYTADDIPQEKLLGKNGKKLVGGALQMRVRKILEEMNK